MGGKAFWVVVVVLTVCNGLVAWGSSFKDMGLGDRPSIMERDWFSMATLIGSVGWLAIPLMFGWRYGILAAAVSLPIYIVGGLVISFVIKGAIADVVERERNRR
jgi:hypothetical protein